MNISLNPEQEMAVRAPLKPLLIIAGAGTGKTRVLTSRLLRLLEQGANPAKICAITFTNKAAKEMASRIGDSKNLSPNTYHLTPIPFIGTFHALGARILRVAGKTFGRTASFGIFDEHDSFNLLKKVLRKMEVKRRTPAYFRNMISAIKNGSAENFEREDKSAHAVFETYEKALAENNAFDFDDLVYRATLALRASQPAAKFGRFTHVMVDEYQDMNNAQYDFLKTLSAGAESVTVVGDSDQTIYSWRGSNIRIFLGFEKDWPGAQVVQLKQNYRSTPTIISAASELIKNNSMRPMASLTHDLWTEKPDGPAIKIFEALNTEGEAEWIAGQIGDRLKMIGDSVAILYRTNAQSRALEQALIGHDIPYQIFGGLKFYERREIKDILAGLRLAANPRDSISRDRLEKAFRKSVFLEVTAAMLAVKHDFSPTDAIGLFLKSADYFAYVEKNLTNPEERRENIKELVRFAARFESLPDFLERVTLLQSTDNTGNSHLATGKAAACLMTMHLAKGLEFDRVFIAGAAEGLLPHARSIESREELEEERRLMYVAMTRARRELFISFYDFPSRFLGELPADCAEFESEADGEKILNEEEKYITLD